MRPQTMLGARTRVSLLLGVAAAAVSAAGCERGDAPAAASPTAKVLATVNGEPIVEEDVLLRLKSQGRHAPLSPAERRNLLDVVIEQELFAQRATELGLDADPAYQGELRELEARVSAFRRKGLADLLYRKELAARAAVTDEEARAHYERNAARIRTEVHVFQILRRSEASIAEAAAALAKGGDFEQVARSQLENLPPSERPWDLGYLKLEQVPEQWRSVVWDLEPGEVSRIIAGPKERFWILKLIAKREDPSVTFDRVKPALLEQLRSKRLEELRAKEEEELRRRAKIVYVED